MILIFWLVTKKFLMRQLTKFESTFNIKIQTEENHYLGLDHQLVCVFFCLTKQFIFWKHSHWQVEQDNHQKKSYCVSFALPVVSF